MAPKLVLTYFDIPGRAEPIRLALKHGKVAFEDKRVSFQEWGALKGTSPNGHLPMLEVDGKVFCESIAILNYACALGKLTPTDDLTKLRNSMIVHALEDIWPPVGACIKSSDENKPAAIKKAVEELLPPVFANIERMVAAGAHSSGLTCGSTPVAADFVLYCVVNALTAGIYGPKIDDFGSKYPAMAKTHQAMKSIV